MKEDKRACSSALQHSIDGSQLVARNVQVAGREGDISGALFTLVCLGQELVSRMVTGGKECDENKCRA